MLALTILAVLLCNRTQPAQHSGMGACRGGAGAACNAASALAGAPVLHGLHSRAAAGACRGQPPRGGQMQRDSLHVGRWACCLLRMQLPLVHPAPGLTPTTRPVFSSAASRALLSSQQVQRRHQDLGAFFCGAAVRAEGNP